MLSKDQVGRHYFPSLIWKLVLGVLVPSRLGILGPQHLSHGLAGQVGEGDDGCPGWWWCVTMQWWCGDHDDDDTYIMLIRMARVCVQRKYINLQKSTFCICPSV